MFNNNSIPVATAPSEIKNYWFAVCRAFRNVMLAAAKAGLYQDRGLPDLVYRAAPISIVVLTYGSYVRVILLPQDTRLRAILWEYSKLIKEWHAGNDLGPRPELRTSERFELTENAREVNLVVDNALVMALDNKLDPEVFGTTLAVELLRTIETTSDSVVERDPDRYNSQLTRVGKWNYHPKISTPTILNIKHNDRSTDPNDRN